MLIFEANHMKKKYLFNLDKLILDIDWIKMLGLAISGIIRVKTPA
jgi:hypothetical protein